MSEECRDLPPPPPPHRHCPLPLLKPGCNLLIIAANGWRCDLNSYFKSGAVLWEPLRRERAEGVTAGTDGGSSSLDRHTTKHTAAVQESRGQTARLFRSCKTTMNYSAFFLLNCQATVTGATRGITQMRHTTVLADYQHQSKITSTVIFVSSNNMKWIVNN